MNKVEQSTDTEMPPNSEYRWRTGHYCFFLVLQGLVLALRRVEDAVEQGDTPEASAALESASALMWASAVAMRFAGDFSAGAYREEVRPTMEPPHVPDGFSGLLSSDHQVMVGVLKRLKPAFTAPPPGLVGARDRFYAALDAAYDSHRFVCSRFDGEAAPSLRMADGAAVDVLRRFQEQRLALVASPKPPVCPFHTVH